MRANTVSCVVIATAGTIESMAKASNYVAVYDGENVTLKTKKIHQYTNLFIRVESWGSYGYAVAMPNVIYPNADCNDQHRNICKHIGGYYRTLQERELMKASIRIPARPSRKTWTSQASIGPTACR